MRFPEGGFPGWRWLSIALRTAHLAGVVLAGVALLGNGALSTTGIALMSVTGIGLYGIELRRHRGLWREVAGVFVAVKLALLAAMVVAAHLAAPLFWLLLVLSAIVSHAPRGFRHRRLIG